MEQVKCSYCKSEDLKYDSSTNMYYCHTCSRLLDKDEVVECALEESTGDDEGEDLSMLSLFFLNIALWVPIVNILTVFAINNSGVRPEYKKDFSSRLVTGLFAIIAAVLVFALYVYDGKTDYKKSIKSFMDKVVVEVSTLNKGDTSMPDFTSIDIVQHIVDNSPIEEEEDDELLTADWKLLDGMMASGSKAQSLLKSVDEQVAILVQTEEIRNRYTKNTYRNVGYLINGSGLMGTTENYSYEGSLSDYVSLWTNDYGDIVYMKTDDIYNKKYVYYLNPSYDYKIHILLFEDDTLAGFAFEEVATK